MPITDNNGSQFYTLNLGKSFVQTITTGFTKLSSFVCSEVLVVNRGSTTVNLYDNNTFDDNFSFILSAGDSVSFRGISNCDSISAKSPAGSGQLNYRTSRFNSHNA